MESERFSIEIFKDHVIVWGYLTSNELQDLIELFKKWGFINVSIGVRCENSTLVMTR